MRVCMMTSMVRKQPCPCRDSEEIFKVGCEHREATDENLQADEQWSGSLASSKEVRRGTLKTGFQDSGLRFEHPDKLGINHSFATEGPTTRWINKVDEGT